MGSFTVKKLTNIEKKVKKNFKQKIWKDWTKWNRKMVGRSFNITTGAFKDILMHSRLVHLDGHIFVSEY